MTIEKLNSKIVNISNLEIKIDFLDEKDYKKLNVSVSDINEEREPKSYCSAFAIRSKVTEKEICEMIECLINSILSQWK